MNLLLATLFQGVHCVSVLIMTGVDINTSVSYCVCVLGVGGGVGHCVQGIQHHVYVLFLRYRIHSF